MEILENQIAWAAHFNDNWLAHAEAAREADWKIYQPPRNQQVPGTPGVDVASSRLMLISSAGGYVRERQPSFAATSLFGDYGIRTFPITTPFSALAYAHDHYDHAMIDADPQVALPLELLQEMAENGRIGSLASSVVSFMGYQPDSARVVAETIPTIVAAAKAENINAALLAPV